MTTIRHGSAWRNMLAWFRHMLRTPPPPQDADAVLRLLRLSARVMEARNPEAAAKLTASADAFQQAVRLTRQHGDQPTNDELTAILSNAQLDIQDQFSAQMELSKAILQAVRGTEAAVGELRATFHTVGEQLTDLEGRVGAAEAKLIEHDRSRDQSVQERRELRDRDEEAERQRMRIETTVNELVTEFHGFRDEIRALIRPPDEVARLVGLIEKHEAEYQARLREAGDG